MNPPRFKFCEQYDLHLAREVYGLNPYEDPQRWKIISINMIQITGRSVSVRTLRDRIKNLVKKYLAKAESLKGKSGIEIQTSEMDDLLQQIGEMMKDNALKKNVQNIKPSYLKGFETRERACSSLSNYDSSLDSPKDNNLAIEEIFIENVDPVSIEEFSQSVEIEDMLDNTEDNTNQYSQVRDNSTCDLNKTSDLEVKTAINPKKRRCLAQTNILSPKLTRTKNNVKQRTIQYLENKAEKQFEIRSKEMQLQERKLVLEEKKLEIDRLEREKQMELNERRLEIEEKKVKIQLDVFSNQQEIIKLLVQSRN